MHSKTLNPQNSRSLWKAESHCSESQLALIAGELAHQLKAGDRVALEGPMGVGKTTFARALLAGLGLVQPPEGSPTFAIAHEYSTPQGEVAHVDFYRLNSELEIEEAGIPAYLWERNLIVITEWLSSWPGFEDQVYQSDRIFEVLLEHVREVDDVPLEDVRQIKIFLHARR